MRPHRTPEETERVVAPGVEPPPELFSGTKKFSNAHHRFGDLLPLPLPRETHFTGSPKECSSRRSQLRVSKRRRMLEAMEGTVRALNSLGGFGNPDEYPAAPMNSAQKAALGRIRQAHSQRPPPVMHESCGGALQQLLKSKGSAQCGIPVPESPGQLTSYMRDRLSLPRGQRPPTLLADILPKKERNQLNHFESEMLLSPEEMGAAQEGIGHNDCYMDPLLANDGERYHQLIADLYECELLGFTQQPRVQVGLFFVTKKGGKQRLIVDARRSNKLFRTPPSTILGSIDSWSRLELENDEDLFIAQEDVKDYFYRLGISEDLGKFFALPPIDPDLLRVHLGHLPSTVEDLRRNSGGPIYPIFRVLPMGFSWAFHMAHEAHCELGRRTLREAPLLQDRRPAPSLGRGPGQHKGCMLIYADNNNHLGIDSEEVTSSQSSMMATLHSLNLDTHDITDSAPLAESLGVRIDGLAGSIQPTPHRDWRLDRALRALSTRPMISGEQLQVVVGHITVRALLHRGLMGIFRYVYVFIESCYTRKQKLWKSVADELEIFRNLMPLATANIRAEWDGEPLCTDASLSGYAVKVGDHTSGEVAQHGRHDERWRFKRQDGSAWAPRERALQGLDVFSDPLTVRPEVEGEVAPPWTTDGNFPEISKNMVDKSRWKKLWNSRVRFKEPIHNIEARSVLAAVKHRARDSRRHGRRILVLNDNLGVVLSMQKGRAANYGLLRIIRRVSAHLLASGIRLSCRWLPSEWNLADEASRFWEDERRREEGQAKKEKSRGFHPCSSARLQPENDESFGGEAGEQTKEEKQIKIAAQGPGAGHAPGSWAADHDPRCCEEEREGQSKAEEALAEAESQFGPPIHPGAEQREGAAEEGLLEAASEFLRVCGSFRTQYPKRARAGCGSVRLCRPPLPEWRRMRCRKQAESSDRVRSTRVLQKFGAQVAKAEEGFERLEEDGAHTDQAADDRVHQELDKWPDDTPGMAHDGAVQRIELFDLLSPWGTPSSACSGCRPAKPGLPPSRSGALAVRKGREQQSRRVRRSADPGRHPRPLAGRSFGQGGEGHPVGHGGGGVSLGLQCGAVSQGVEGLRGMPSGRSHRRVALPEQTWRSVTGPSVETSIGGCYPEERPMERGCQRSHLRQAWPPSTDGEQVQLGARTVRGGDPPELCGLFLREEKDAASSKDPCPHPGKFQDQKFLSLFGGVGNPAKFFSRCGGEAWVVDLCDSASNDLGRPSKWNAVLKSVHVFDYIGIDLPCNTWSKARRAPPWSRLPKPLRSADRIYGLQSLSPGDGLKVTAANKMLVGAVRTVRKCLKLGIVGYLENPRNSWVWQTPLMLRLLKHPRIQLVTCHQCQYGCQWKKPTSR